MDLKELKVHDTVIRHPWEIARFEVIYQLINKYAVQFFNTGVTILDIGCGDTFFVEKLASRLPSGRFLGVDIAFDEKMIETYNNKLTNSNVRVYNKLDDIELEDNSKAVGVLLLDVIEHVSNDVSFLKMLVSNPLVTDETLFIISVPAFQSLFSSHDVFLVHYRRYSNKSLKETIRKAGLQPVEIGYFFFSLLPVRWLEVLMEKIMGQNRIQQKGIGGWQSNRVKEKILKNLLLLDFNIMLIFKKIGIQLPGLSNFIICRKSVS